MDKELLDYARMISLMARQGILRPDAATDFCQRVLPDLTYELEVLEGVAQRLSQMMAAAISGPEPEPEPEPAPKAKRSRSRRRKEPAND